MLQPAAEVAMDPTVSSGATVRIVCHRAMLSQALVCARMVGLVLIAHSAKVGAVAGPADTSLLYKY